MSVKEVLAMFIPVENLAEAALVGLSSTGRGVCYPY